MSNSLEWIYSCARQVRPHIPYDPEQIYKWDLYRVARLGSPSQLNDAFKGLQMILTEENATYHVIRDRKGFWRFTEDMEAVNSYTSKRIKIGVTHISGGLVNLIPACNKYPDNQELQEAKQSLESLIPMLIELGITYHGPRNS